MPEVIGSGSKLSGAMIAVGTNAWPAGLQCVLRISAGTGIASSELQQVETVAMQALILLAILAVPPLTGSIAVAQWPGPAGFVIALGASLFMLRDALQICMMLMRRWQLFGRDMFLIEQKGRHRWVDAFELKSMQVPCRVQRQEFRPSFLDGSRRDPR
jgi:hypothetical protein